MSLLQELWVDFRRINITFWVLLLLVLLNSMAINFVIGSWFFWGDLFNGFGLAIFAVLFFLEACFMFFLWLESERERD